MPVLIVAIGLVIVRGWCRGSGSCRCASTRVNRVLREQITGIRVVRAFVREPFETRAVRVWPTPSSPTSRWRVGRLMALIFPTVMLVLNVSSVAVLWFGAPASTPARCRSAR